MITVGYPQRTIYEPLALNVMADYKELCWERWLLAVNELLAAGHAGRSGVALDGAEALAWMEF
jgi:hypothetical protein